MADTIADENRVKGRRDLKATLNEALSRERRAVLVVNGRARRGKHLYAAAKAVLTQKGLRLDATYLVRDPGRLPEILHDSIAHGHKLIVVGGGDGTISSVVDEFAHSSAVLGLLPLGTANSFLRTLGIPLTLEGAASVLTGGGKVADVDLGKINDDYFANTASIGLPAQVARRLPHRLKRYLGKLGYVLVGGARFLSHEPFSVRLIRDGTEVAGFDDALDVLIANGPYQGGVLVSTEADVESRDLVIRVIRGSKSNLLRTWLGLKTGLRAGSATTAGADFLETLRATDVVIETAPRQYVSVDGEVVTQTPIRATLARQALMLMVPQDFMDRTDPE
jgi:YegS/Rv2252/BmrU family lipid kinase